MMMHQDHVQSDCIDLMKISKCHSKISILMYINEDAYIYKAN
jgi:hypothetical protein